jgi:hypothetical protein
MLLASLLVLDQAGAVDLLTFRDASGRIITFAVYNLGPVPATVDQTAATQVAINWAQRFYHVDDLDIVAVEFETRPTRFWKVTFAVSEHGRLVHLYAVVLPDGRPVEPTAREET